MVVKCALITMARSSEKDNKKLRKGKGRWRIIRG
jgi:hypothetical protein